MKQELGKIAQAMQREIERRFIAISHVIVANQKIIHLRYIKFMNLCWILSKDVKSQVRCGRQIGLQEAKRGWTCKRKIDDNLKDKRRDNDCLEKKQCIEGLCDDRGQVI